MRQAARRPQTLLADTMVKLTDHDSLSGETVRRRLTENDLKPWRRDMWCIPHVDGEYVDRMQDVLDYEYRRNGTVNLFVTFDPHRGWRNVKVTDRRAATDYAHCMRELVDVHCIAAWQQQRNKARDRINRRRRSDAQRCFRSRASG